MSFPGIDGGCLGSNAKQCTVCCACFHHGCRVIKPLLLFDQVNHLPQELATGQVDYEEFKCFREVRSVPMLPGCAKKSGRQQTGLLSTRAIVSQSNGVVSIFSSIPSAEYATCHEE